MAMIDVVQWHGTPDIFAWRFPESNLTTLTQLIVNQSQEAILFRKGAMFAKFGPGKHTLSTENIPVLENLYGIPFGGKNPFTAEVWFVNKVFSLDVKWGTEQPFLIRDPEFGVMIPVRGFGQFGIRIGDAETFLVKLVGTLPSFDKERLKVYFRGLLLSRATSIIARTITEEKVSVLDIAAQTARLSEILQQEMQSTFTDYGIELVNFYISQISIPDDDSSVLRLKELLSKRAEMTILGYTYQQERSFDVLKDAAKNEGAAGTIMGAGMGLGMGFGVGGAVGGMMQGVSGQVQSAARKCTSCGCAIPDQARFCPGCATPSGAPQPVQKIVCDKCGHQIPADSKFCPGCGDSYNPCPVCRADVSPNVSVCPACGAGMPAVCVACRADVLSGARFCPGCGNPMYRLCPGCGCEVGAGQAFCADCGVEIEK